MKKTSIRRDIFSFLKAPDYNKFPNMSDEKELLILVKVFILTNIALVIVSIPTLILKKLEIISEIPMKSDLILNTIQAQNTGIKPYFIFSVLLCIPLLEEFSFRLFLAKFRIDYFIISVSIFCGILIKYLLGNIFWIPKSWLILSFIGAIYMLLIGSLIAGILFLFKNKIIRIEEFWNKNMGLIIYGVAIIFAFMHLMNLKFEMRDLIFMPIVLLPLFVYGISFAYLRIRLGIIYSIALHFITLALRFGVPELTNYLKSNL